LASTICFFGIIHLSLSRKNNTIKYSKPLTFPFNVIKQLTFIGANVLFQGVDPGFHSVLFHHIILKSDFVSEQVVVEDVFLLFGIDLTVTKL
jgi:hypothetical protein